MLAVVISCSIVRVDRDNGRKPDFRLFGKRPPGEQPSRTPSWSNTWPHIEDRVADLEIPASLVGGSEKVYSSG
jgi:hypothetical protein